MMSWGGARAGAGRKRDPMLPLRRRRAQQLKEAKRLLESALYLQQLEAGPPGAVEAAIKAARRLVKHARQLDLALDPAAAVQGSAERAVVAAAARLLDPALRLNR